MWDGRNVPPAIYMILFQVMVTLLVDFLKIVRYGLMKKNCSVCNCLNSTSAVFKQHSCSVNWDAGSGVMEAGLAVQLVLKINKMFKGLVCVREIVTDNDSKMRSHLRNKRDSGKLPDDIIQPIFLANPSRRIKVMLKYISAMISNTKDPDKCKTINATRIKKVHLVLYSKK